MCAPLLERHSVTLFSLTYLSSSSSYLLLQNQITVITIPQWYKTATFVLLTNLLTSAPPSVSQGSWKARADPSQGTSHV